MEAILLHAQSARDAWFDEFIAKILTHKLLLDTDIADAQTKFFYEMAMSGNDDGLALSSLMSSNQHFIKKIVLEYLKSVSKEDLPVKLGLDLNGSEILVWAQIADADTSTEDRLLLLEAEVNGKYHEFGFDLTTTIVENSDGMTMPSHYVNFF